MKRSYQQVHRDIHTLAKQGAALAEHDRYSLAMIRAYCELLLSDGSPDDAYAVADNATNGAVSAFYNRHHKERAV